MRSNDVSCEDNGLKAEERRAINDLKLFQRYMSRVRNTLTNKNLIAESFFAAAHLLVEGILSKLPDFQEYLQDFYAQRR